MTIKVYIAGPLFTKQERELLEEIDALCSNLGIATYLPHRDAGLFDMDEETSTRTFFEHDLREIQNADMLIAVLNGADVDAGTSWEMGYAFALGKIIFGYLDDIRIFNPTLQINLMLTNSVHSLSHSIPELGTHIIDFVQSKQ